MLAIQDTSKTKIRKTEYLKVRTISLIIIILIIVVISALIFIVEAKAESILSEAEAKASRIIFNANVDSNKKVAEISNSAQKRCNTIIEKTNEQANITIQNANTQSANIIKASEEKSKNIIEAAEKKSNNIIQTAIDTKIDEVEILLAITEAEAGNQSLKGKAAVAATILNRVKSGKFGSNTIEGIVYSPGQFQAVTNGSINNVDIDTSTIEAVTLCFKGKDYSNGALYFYNPENSEYKNIKWFKTLYTTAIIGDHTFKK
jgi:N-acetylmuramoyl-L-alanine amidase